MPQNAFKIAPSILAANFARLGEQVAEAERCGADRIHVDVMDGHFCCLSESTSKLSEDLGVGNRPEQLQVLLSAAKLTNLLSAFLRPACLVARPFTSNGREQVFIPPLMRRNLGMFAKDFCS